MPDALNYAVIEINFNVLLYNVPLYKETLHIRIIPVHNFNFQKNTKKTTHYFLYDYKMINYENMLILYSGKHGISLCALAPEILKTCGWTAGIPLLNHKGMF
jgi:hypothetical protein